MKLKKLHLSLIAVASALAIGAAVAASQGYIPLNHGAEDPAQVPTAWLVPITEQVEVSNDTAIPLEDVKEIPAK